MKLSIHQPMYIPWIPYFVKIIYSDLFIFFDDVQFPGGKSYMNRNYIRAKSGKILLTVNIKRNFDKKLINQIIIDDNSNWKKKHLKSISLNYKSSNFFNSSIDEIVEIYEKNHLYLADLNIDLIKFICNKSNIKTKFIRSSDLNINNINTGDKIIEIIKAVHGNLYITGQGAGSNRYIVKENYKINNISLNTYNYNNIQYKQLFAGFESDCSMMDLLFNYGDNTGKFLLENSIIKEY